MEITISLLLWHAFNVCTIYVVKSIEECFRFIESKEHDRAFVESLIWVEWFFGTVTFMALKGSEFSVLLKIQSI